MSQKKNPKSALHVQPGIEQPSQVNEKAVRKLKSRKADLLSADDYVQGILNGDQAILGKAITMVESSRDEHQALAQKIIAECLKHTSSSHPATSIRVGITGVPGVGKSTFIETLGKQITGKGHKLAVLAVDPSSTLSKGSILADKTRMEELAVDPNAFIRPSPASGVLGGVARKTRETIFLCESAGYDVILIETVGVGQSETTVKSMVDFFLLLMLAGAGDELQGMKRGIIEMADAIIINKADGDNLQKAKVAATEYRSAMHLFPPANNEWTPVVDICSATTGFGVKKIWDLIEKFRTTMIRSGHFQQTRLEQNKRVLHEVVEEKLHEQFYKDAAVKRKIRKLEQQIINGIKNPYQAAAELLFLFQKR